MMVPLGPDQGAGQMPMIGKVVGYVIFLYINFITTHANISNDTKH